MVNFQSVGAVFKREFKWYFASPVAYVFLIAFLVLTGFLTFVVTGFYEMRQANLSPFFFWHPWVYLLLVPAATMGSWAEERRTGTIELLLTLPVTLCEVLLGKFLAAWAFMTIALALTFPIVCTTFWLGSPDTGVIISGYFGSFLLSGACVAIGIFASALSRSQVIGFVIALASCLLLMLIGFEPLSGALAGWGWPRVIVDALAGCSLLTHYQALQLGVIDLADVGYYLGVMVFFLAVAHVVVDNRKAN